MKFENGSGYLKVLKYYMIGSEMTYATAEHKNMIYETFKNNHL